MKAVDMTTEPLVLPLTPQRDQIGYTVWMPVLPMPVPITCGKGETPQAAIDDLNRQLARDKWADIYQAELKPAQPMLHNGCQECCAEAGHFKTCSQYEPEPQLNTWNWD